MHPVGPQDTRSENQIIERNSQLKNNRAMEMPMTKRYRQPNTDRPNTQHSRR